MMNLLLGNAKYTMMRALASEQVLNEGCEDELECFGYKGSRVKRTLFYVSVACTLGLILLVIRWKPQLGVYLTKRRCPLVKADSVLLKDNSGAYFVEVIQSFVLDNPKLECEILRQDSTVETTPDYGPSSESTDLTQLLEDEPIARIKYIDHHHTRYIWNRVLWAFVKLQGLDYLTQCTSLSTDYNGLSTIQQEERWRFYGDNSIDIHVKSYWRLFIDEVLNPFYIFQVFSVTLWSVDEYYYYAACILLISAISIGVSLYETKKQMVTLCEKVASRRLEMKVCRGGNEWETIDSRCLVPGDVIALTVVSTDEVTMPCDAVILAGNCIVNESMLTGESVPEKKSPLVRRDKNEVYSISRHKRHTLFSGTRIIQTSGGDKRTVQALVLRTGFNTTKGDLVRSILFPKAIGFQFYKDAILFVIFLSLVATCGMIFSVAVLVYRKTHVSKIIIRTLDIITIAVPPALPAAMTVGTVYAQSRLKKQSIFCISPPRINFSGKIKLFCFDKTGTLTQDGLDMWGVVPVTDSRFDSVVQDPRKLKQGAMLSGMATCHSIVTINGQHSGDPLDLIMFNSIGWIIESTSRYEQLVDTVVTPVSRDMFRDEHTALEIATLKEFPFSSELQRMTVLTQSTLSDRIEVYSKGAPEKICSLCRDSSVPPDFSEVLHKFTVEGFRVIALAWKQLKSGSRWHQVLRMSREDVESDLNFLGLIVLQNALKPETTPVIARLSAANIRTVMITGDNILTAISVARKCGMVAMDNDVVEVTAVDPGDGSSPKISLQVIGQPRNEGNKVVSSQSIVEMSGSYHFAVSGKTFGVVVSKCSKSLLASLCVRGTIFARMSPNQKQQLVESLQELGYSVGMCGDGANDCGALKTAHAGISLSEEEASVASPFTSKVQNIECVPTLIREGRAALVTSFGCFKYMALYSIIQFVSVLILYWFETNLSDMMFIYIDLFVTTTVAILMGYTGAYTHLVPQRPRGSLVNPANLINILLQILLVTLIQVAALLHLVSQSWYKRVVPNDNASAIACYESMLIFMISAFQYVIMAFVFSKGPPFRKRLWTNWLFFVALLIILACTTFFLFIPASSSLNGFLHFFMFVLFPNDVFKVTILILAGVNLLLSFFVEYLMEDNRAVKRIMKHLRRNKTPKHKYKLIEMKMARHTSSLSEEYLLNFNVEL